MKGIRIVHRLGPKAAYGLLLGVIFGLSLASHSNGTDAAISSQDKKPVRPDIDENDRWRDQRFDMDSVLDGLEIRPGMTVAEYNTRLPQGQMDMIFIHAVIQFVEDRPRFLRAAGAGLKTNGCMVIIEPESEDPRTVSGVMGPGRFPTREGYLEIFRRAGLDLVSVTTKQDRNPPKIGSSWKTIFILQQTRQ